MVTTFLLRNACFPRNAWYAVCIVLSATFTFHHSAFAVTPDVQNSITRDIQQAQKTLQQTEKKIGGERAAFARQLNNLEQEVIELRKKTAVNRRLSDENTLSLSQLEERQQRWKEQTQYQQNLLNRFVQQHSLSAPKEKSSEQNALTVLMHYSENLQQRFYPTWQENNIVLPSGELRAAHTLSVGPVIWYYQEQQNLVGIAQLDKSNLLAGYELGTNEGVRNLFHHGQGLATFDPSLDRAMARAQQQESTFEHISKGGIWAIPIILFALFALSIAIAKSVQLWRLPKVVQLSPSQLQAMHSKHASTNTPALGVIQQDLLRISQNTEVSQERDDLLFSRLSSIKHTLDRWLGAIAITASVSPLLGLLGTVSGMIETFKMMTLFGAGDPEVVSGGIAQALITTELGLVVAIPALVLNALLSRKAKSYYHDIENFAIQLSQVDGKVNEVKTPTQQTSQRTKSEEEALAC
ncbi:Biopolymer transport protein ExbB [Thalassocella blandensis]|nr:Biopolymer transport protein ExbB [Thalassocella blandensis]